MRQRYLTPLRIATLLVLSTGSLTITANAIHAEETVMAPISQRMDDFVAEGQITGAVTLVARDGKIVHLDGVGMANVAEKRPMATDTMFRIASMTKPITATAVMILADEGKLSLDDLVEKYIPLFGNAKTESGEPIVGLTIRHLLTHTSGLVGEQRCEGSLEETATMLAERPFGFKPGEKWQYSPGLNVCGRVVEIASGQSFDAFLADRIFTPLGMNDTTFHPTAEQWPRVAELYEISKEDQSLVVHKPEFARGQPGSVPSPSGGLFSTAGNMFRFYQMILGGGELDGVRIVSEDAVRQMTTLQSGDLRTGFTPGNGWGLGWCITLRPENITGMLSPGTYGHGGAFGTQGWVDPQRRMILVMMIQRAGLPNSDGSEMREAFQQAAVDELERK
jgi:CubicO group peptidase (beta-lactamase class C family)